VTAKGGWFDRKLQLEFLIKGECCISCNVVGGVKLDEGPTRRMICISKRLLVNTECLTRCLWRYEGFLYAFYDLVCGYKREPKMKEEFLASEAKVLVKSSMSNTKRLNRAKTWRILHLIQKKTTSNRKKLFLLICH